jgi:CubicO group peptidase (beta-lactamase class C family)
MLQIFEPLGIAATPRSGQSFGLGLMVRTQRGEHPTLGEPGEFYWQGAWGTAFFVDPKKKLVAVLMLQVPLLQAPHYQSLFHNLVHQALVN